MGRLSQIIQECTAGIGAVQIDYSDAYPNARDIAARCTIEEVREILREIEVLAVERENADEEGTANGDDLDFYWGRMTRYASLLPDLMPNYRDEIVAGLGSRRVEVRLFVAQALIVRPSRFAVGALKTSLAAEKPGPTRELIRHALSRCSSVPLWRRIFSWK